MGLVKAERTNKALMLFQMSGLISACRLNGDVTRSHLVERYDSRLQAEEACRALRRGVDFIRL